MVGNAVTAGRRVEGRRRAEGKGQDRGMDGRCWTWVKFTYLIVATTIVQEIAALL